MKVRFLVTAMMAGLCIGSPVIANDSAPANEAKPAMPKPKLIVAISVDQLSSDLFSEYRGHFQYGMKRLLSGAVFPSGYQSHAATETCPGHATILTGVHPGRAGIIANSWIDQSIKRDNKIVYCAEDERIDGTSFGDITAAQNSEYVESSWHLNVPVLGQMLKAQNPKSRNVAIAGKDRSALMMASESADQIYWWKESKTARGFATVSGRAVTGSIAAINSRLGATIDAARAADAIPAHCESHNAKIPVVEGKSVGDYAFARPAGAGTYFRLSPDLDRAVLDGAAALVKDMNLGKGPATDILSVGLSATDFIGHAFGPQGLEMCLQMAALDKGLGEFFDVLDKAGTDYLVVLTADHGGHDLPERLQRQGFAHAERVDPALNAKDIGEAVKAELGMSGSEPLLLADSPFGDYYIHLSVPAEQRAAVQKAAMTKIASHPQVAAVLDGQELASLPIPSGSPESWSLAHRARASYAPGRSGDFIVLLKKMVTPISDPRRYVATHGSAWDYDRRVPILFWRAGMTGFEQANSVQVIDIAPTLAAIAGLPVGAGDMDGRCLDLDAGAADSCL